MIAAFVVGMATGVALTAAAATVVTCMTLGGRSSARHWQTVRELIYGNEGGDE